MLIGGGGIEVEVLRELGSGEPLDLALYVTKGESSTKPFSLEGLINE